MVKKEFERHNSLSHYVSSFTESECYDLEWHHFYKISQNTIVYKLQFTLSFCEFTGGA